MQFQDLTGQQFGRLTAVGYFKENSKTKWSCRCECGQMTAATTSDLRAGKTVSCGCFRADSLRERRTTL